MNKYKFFPGDAESGKLDLNMRRLLAESIQHICEASVGVLSYDRLALKRLIDGLSAGGRYSPYTYGLYTELVFAIEETDYARATSLLATLGTQQPLVGEPWQLVSLGDECGEGATETYRRLMDSDPNTRFDIYPPSPEQAESFRTRFRSGFQLLERAMPELAEEFNSLVSQVVMVVGDTSSNYQFDGGSSYMLWGGLFLNATSHDSDVAIVEVLAHESAHILLFGFARDEPLVLNGDDELFQSPLRSDLRPMDGIYHSTYVSARMHWAMARLLKSGLLDDNEQLFAEKACATDRRNFYDGYRVVENSALLSETGKAVMASAKDYMDSMG